MTSTPYVSQNEPLIDFQSMQVARPDMQDVVAEYKAIESVFAQAAGMEERLDAVKRWDALCRRIDTWESLTHLRFNQDTRNPEYKAERELCDELAPAFTELAVGFKRTLVSDADETLKEAVGRHAFALWETDITTFEPAICDDLVQENKLIAEYIALTASAELDFRGEKVNLSGIGKFCQSSDRDIRHEAEAVRWQWFDANEDALDRMFDDLVKLRTGMARKLGFENYIELGYRRMQRIDYTQHDVETFRGEVQRHVVPLAVQLRKTQASNLGVDSLMAWDELVHDPTGNPVPKGDHDWMIDRATEMFDAISPEMGAFFQMMNTRDLLDLKTREGKAGGGFCTSLVDHNAPFIFANFNGTKDDVEVFTHEVGHAFQNWMSRDVPLLSYLWPTCEACEVHSMGLEFLTWPHMEKFFEENAERFRTIHLTESLLFIPYGVAVDHFQHLVYANPDATPAERKKMWLKMEATYLPWRQWGDLTYPSKGGRWQLQGHIYRSPFYYIDYTLALSCALQLWDRSERDFGEALSAYTALCVRGGEAPFQELVRSADLIPPFEAGCLDRVVARAKLKLGI